MSVSLIKKNFTTKYIVFLLKNMDNESKVFLSFLR